MEKYVGSFGTSKCALELNTTVGKISGEKQHYTTKKLDSLRVTVKTVPERKPPSYSEGLSECSCAPSRRTVFTRTGLQNR